MSTKARILPGDVDDEEKSENSGTDDSPLVYS